jgi:hypothetical protein
MGLGLSGCNLFGPAEDQEVVYPPGIITPAPTTDVDDENEEEMEEEIEDENAEPTEDASPTEMMSPTPEVSAEPTKADKPTDGQTEPIAENKIVINSVEAKYEEGMMLVHVEGTYPDQCTNSKYSWSITGNNVEIDLGSKEGDSDVCAASTKPYSGDIKINYTFKSGEEYVAVVNGMESNPVTIE